MGTFTLGSPVRNKTVLKQRLLGELKRHNKLNYESESRHQHSFWNCASQLATKRDWDGQTSFLGIKVVGTGIITEQGKQNLLLFVMVCGLILCPKGVYARVDDNAKELRMVHNMKKKCHDTVVRPRC